MKAVYISVPITGRKIEDVKKHISFVTYTHLKEYEIINPLKIFDVLKREVNEIPSYAKIIGFDIMFLIEQSEAVFFCRGWHESKGCQLEFAAAKIYVKEIMFE